MIRRYHEQYGNKHFGVIEICTLHSIVAQAIVVVQTSDQYYIELLLPHDLLEVPAELHTEARSALPLHVPKYQHLTL